MGLQLLNNSLFPFLCKGTTLGTSLIVSSQTLNYELYYFIIDEKFSLNVGAMDF